DPGTFVAAADFNRFTGHAAPPATVPAIDAITASMAIRAEHPAIRYGYRFTGSDLPAFGTGGAIQNLAATAARLTQAPVERCDVVRRKSVRLEAVAVTRLEVIRSSDCVRSQQQKAQDEEFVGQN